MRRARRALAVLPLAVLTAVAGCGDDGSAPLPRASASRAVSPPSADDTKLRLQEVGRFQQPIHITAPVGDPRLFVVEKGGRVRVLRDGKVLPQPFLDIADQVSTGSEQGLLSMAFAPDYARTRALYVDYTDTDGSTRVVEYRADPANPDRVDPGTRRELIRVAQPYENHNGGLLLFDPAGNLVIGLGDGGSAGDPQNRAQNLGERLGKLLRISPRPAKGQPYGIPADNPYVQRDGARPEIWVSGVRNPWRFAFDPQGGDLWVADVGQNALEEITVLAPAEQSGANLGWRVYEGDLVHRDEAPGPGPLREPLHVYNHADGRCSITGGVVHRGSLAALRGRFVFGDVCSGETWSVGRGGDVRRLPFDVPQVVGWGADAAGETYVASLQGQVWRLTAS